MIKDLLLYFFGLPGIFFVIFMMIIFALYTAKYAKAKVLSLVLIGLVFVFSNVATGKFLSSILIENVTFKKIGSLKDIDLVVMPTQGIDYNGRIIGWTPSQESFKAANIAYDLQSKLSDRKVPMLICGGKMEGNGSELAESTIIKNYFNRQTAQIRKTLTEDTSKNLFEQVWQCTNVIKHYGAKNPVLVISELKMLRTLALFRSRGLEMVPVPVFVVKDTRSGWMDFMPSVEGLMLNRSVLIEFFEIGLSIFNQKISTSNLFYKLENKE